MIAVKIILIGPPGAGKGTQAKYICDKYSIPHISTGDIFRKNISEKTPLGNKAKQYIDKGQLVPDELTIAIVEERLQSTDCQRGYLLDGFPRTVDQAEALQVFLKGRNENLTKVIQIDVPDAFILDRMTGRRVCSKCGESYHIKFNPPKIDGICDTCNSILLQRKDDNAETVKERLEIYHKQTHPLVEYYKKHNLLKKVNGTGSIDEVFIDICNVLGSDS